MTIKGRGEIYIYLVVTHITLVTKGMLYSTMGENSEEKK